MTEYKFYYGYAPIIITANNERNAVLKFRQQNFRSSWTIWHALPKEHIFICIRDYHLTDENGVLYYDCEVKPIY